jgi:hypothetical protein
MREVIMLTNRRLWSVLSGGFFVLLSAVSFANEPAELVCPSMEEIGQYSPAVSFPYGFNQQSQKMQVLAAAGKVDENDNGEDSNVGSWVLMIHPLEVGESDVANQVIKDALENLQPVSVTPFQYNVVEDKQLPVCAYRLHGHKEVSALAYYMDDYSDDFDDDDFAKLHPKVSHSKMRVIKMAQHVKQFLVK